MEKQNERISKLEADKYLLQEQVMSLKHANLEMQISKEELEQYRRRFCLRKMQSLFSQMKQVLMYLNMQKKCLMRVNWISSTVLLIELIGLVLNILIIKQRESVRLFLSYLQRSGIKRWCTGQGKKSEIMLKYV